MLAGVALTLKENRNAQVLLMLVPLALVWILYVIVKSMVGLPSSADAELDMVFTSITGIFIAVFLMGGRINSRNRFVVFLIPPLYLLVIVISGLITKDMLPMATLMGISILSLYLAFLGTKLACAKEFSVSRFLKWKGFYLLLSFELVFFITAYFLGKIEDYPLKNMVLQSLILALTCSIISFIALLPFEMLLFVSIFWRRRFDAVFGLKTVEQMDYYELIDH